MATRRDRPSLLAHTALAVGDFDYSNASHHGTPQERRDAWLLGYREGDPRRCREMIPSGHPGGRPTARMLHAQPL